MEGMGLSCAGGPLPRSGGTWKGHVVPGVVFLSWGIWWTLAAFGRYLRARGANGAMKPPAAWYPCELAGRWLRALEPVLKVLGGPIGVSIELYFDSHSGFRTLHCADSGRFSLEHAHNYQHASSYPAFMLSGLVDLLGMYVPLPPGTEQVFVALAFGLEGFLMVLHKKHVPLDLITHELLGWTMLACAAGVLLELRSPASFLLSAFRGVAVQMQGVWLISMGQMLFTGSRAWNDEYAGPAMLAPPFFAMMVLATAAGNLLLFLAASWAHNQRRAYAALPLAGGKEPAGEAGGKEGQADSRQFADFSLDDSAAETSDDGSEHAEERASERPKPKSGRGQLAAALGLLRQQGRQSLGKAPAKPSEHIV